MIIIQIFISLDYENVLSRLNKNDFKKDYFETILV